MAEHPSTPARREPPPAPQPRAALHTAAVWIILVGVVVAAIAGVLPLISVGSRTLDLPGGLFSTQLRLHRSFGGPGQTGIYIWPIAAVALAITATRRPAWHNAHRWILGLLGAGLAAGGVFALTTPARWYASTYDGHSLQASIKGLISRSLITLKPATGAYLLLVAGFLIAVGAVLWRPARRVDPGMTAVLDGTANQRTSTPWLPHP